MAVSRRPEPFRFHVSQDGDDRWSGLLSVPDRDRRDGPFRTLQRAQQTVRELIAGGTASETEIHVMVHEGDHQLTGSLVFAEADSGSPSAPVTWMAAPGADPSISGGFTVRNLQPVSDPVLLARLPKGSRDRVLWSDLKEAGLADTGGIPPQGPPGLEVFHRGERMPLARYPRYGWLKVADVPQDGPTCFHEGLDREKRFHGVPIGRHFGRIAYDDEGPGEWADTSQVYLHGYWTWDWADSIQRLASLDARKRELTLAEPHHSYGYTTGQRFRFLNVMEAMGAPGDWVADFEKGHLFIYPPEETAPGDLVVSALETPLFSFENAAHIRVEGLRFNSSRGKGIAVSGGEGIRIAGCAFLNLGDTAVSIQGGRDHLVDSCDLSHLAGSGIVLEGGERKSLTASGHQVLNNHIHHFSEWLQTRHFGITINGVGSRIAHNLIHDSPFEAIYVRGNEHILEYNEVARVIRQSGDAGALHTGRDFTWQGNVIRYNYWHHLEGPGLHGVMGVYLDDFSTGFTVYGNIFYKAGRATLLSGGHDNTVENNLYIDCAPSIHYDARGLSWAHYFFNGENTWLWDCWRVVNAGRPPYTDRYPALKTMLEDAPAVPKRNRIARNISLGNGRWIDIYDFHAFDFYQSVEIRDNLIANPGICRRRTEAEDFWDPYYLNIDGQEGYTLFLNDDPRIRREFHRDTIVADPPLSFDPDTLCITTLDPERLEAIGFKPIPTDLIGLRKNRWRRCVPERVGSNFSEAVESPAD